MIDKIDSVVNAIGGFLYQPYIVPLFLIVAGLYFTIRTGLIQFRLFGESIHVVAEKPKEKGSISSFGALMVSTASRVGTGNIVGVSTAICLGGFGAVFWMWVVALLGGASAFIESALAQVYKKKDGKGGCVGGKLLFAIRCKLVHQILVFADIDTAAFPFTDGQFHVGFHRDPAIPQGNLIGEVAF